MEAAVIVSVIALTSVGCLVVGQRVLGLSRPRLGSAIWQMLEWVGVSLAFAATNLVLGAAGIILFRELTGTFVSVYLVVDATLILASMLQGLVFFRWFHLEGTGEVNFNEASRKAGRSLHS